MSDLPHQFIDRRQAGVELARLLDARGLPPEPLVLGLPRGGVPVAFEVARALEAPLDVLVVRKIGAPGQPELAIGAIATGGIVVRELDASFYVDELGSSFQAALQRERAELKRREHRYRGGLGPLEIKGRTVILVDDGVATGATMVAAVRAARAAGAAIVIVAAPVASQEAVRQLQSEADDVVIVQSPSCLMSIGEWYEHFEQVEDQEVSALLEEARRHRTTQAP